MHSSLITRNRIDVLVTAPRAGRAWWIGRVSLFAILLIIVATGLRIGGYVADDAFIIYRY